MERQAEVEDEIRLEGRMAARIAVRFLVSSSAFIPVRACRPRWMCRLSFSDASTADHCCTCATVPGPVPPGPDKARALNAFPVM